MSRSVRNVGSDHQRLVFLAGWYLYRSDRHRYDAEHDDRGNAGVLRRLARLSTDLREPWSLDSAACPVSTPRSNAGERLATP